MCMLKPTFLVHRRGHFRIRPFLLLLLVILTVAALLAHFQHSARANNPPWQQFVYNGHAGTRPYFVYTPETYQVGTAVPLIVMLHGCAQTPLSFASGTPLNQLTARYHSTVP